MIVLRSTTNIYIFYKHLLVSSLRQIRVHIYTQNCLRSTICNPRSARIRGGYVFSWNLQEEVRLDGPSGDRHIIQSNNRYKCKTTLNTVEYHSFPAMQTDFCLSSMGNFPEIRRTNYLTVTHPFFPCTERHKIRRKHYLTFLATNLLSLLKHLI